VKFHWFVWSDFLREFLPDFQKRIVSGITARLAPRFMPLRGQTVHLNLGELRIVATHAAPDESGASSGRAIQ
jgi:hypothetical protein